MTATKTKILLIDDHEVVRDGLQHMLEIEDDLEIVGEAGDAKEALKQVEMLNPEIILMDIKMPGVDGIQLTKQLVEIKPNTNIIMLTLYDEYLHQSIEAGAVGYLLKDIKRDELLKAIRAVKEGKSPISLALSRDSLSGLTSGGDDKGNSDLTERELTILRMIASGVTTRELAEQLFLSQASVKRSVGIIFEKMKVRNRSEAVAEAYKRGLITLE